MNGSILESIKKMIGPSEDYTAFDADIAMHLNTGFMVLNQLGVGPKIPFSIGTDGTEQWSDFTDDVALYEAVKTYLYLYVRRVFDPPANSFVMSAIDEQIKELGWRLRLQAQRGDLSSDE